MRLLYNASDGRLGWTDDLIGDQIPSYAILFASGPLQRSDALIVQLIRLVQSASPTPSTI